MPPLMGYLRERSGGFAAPTGLIVGVLVIAALLVAAIRSGGPHEGATPSPR
jgi:hypothetical protein